MTDGEKKNGSVTNILMAGVGGQGIILASEILSDVFLKTGWDVKKSEVHGMAQRGGSVTTHVRFGTKIFSPLIEKGTAHFLLAFEKVEALRYVHFLREEGKVLLADHEIYPLAVSLGLVPYPDNIETLLEQNFETIVVPALSLAEQAGNRRTLNIVMLGVLSEFLDVEDQVWDEVLRKRIRERFLAMNREAFRLGKESVKMSTVVHREGS